MNKNGFVIFGMSFFLKTSLIFFCVFQTAYSQNGMSDRTVKFFVLTSDTILIEVVVDNATQLQSITLSVTNLSNSTIFIDTAYIKLQTFTPYGENTPIISLYHLGKGSLNEEIIECVKLSAGQVLIKEFNVLSFISRIGQDSSNISKYSFQLRYVHETAISDKSYIENESNTAFFSITAYYFMSKSFLLGNCFHYVFLFDE